MNDHVHNWRTLQPVDGFMSRMAEAVSLESLRRRLWLCCCSEARSAGSNHLSMPDIVGRGKQFIVLGSHGDIGGAMRTRADCCPKGTRRRHGGEGLVWGSCATWGRRTLVAYFQPPQHCNETIKLAVSFLDFQQNRVFAAEPAWS